MTKIKLSIEYDKNQGIGEDFIVTTLQETLSSRKFPKLKIVIEDTPKDEPNVTVDEIRKLIARWYSAYSLSPSKELWWDLKLLEAIRRDYE